MTDLPLFQLTPPPTVPPVAEIEVRRKARAAAMEKADAWVMDAYEQMLRSVGMLMPTFGAWDMTALFEAARGKLSTTNKKALGGLYAHLLETGVIVEAGYGKRPNGNLGPIYRLK